MSNQDTKYTRVDIAIGKQDRKGSSWVHRFAKFSRVPSVGEVIFATEEIDLRIAAVYWQIDQSAIIEANFEIDESLCEHDYAAAVKAALQRFVDWDWQEGEPKHPDAPKFQELTYEGDPLPKPTGLSLRALTQRMSVRASCLVASAYPFVSDDRIDLADFPVDPVLKYTDARWLEERNATPEMVQQIREGIQSLLADNKKTVPSK